MPEHSEHQNRHNDNTSHKDHEQDKPQDQITLSPEQLSNPAYLRSYAAHSGNLVQLQRVLGNQAVQRLVRQNKPSPKPKTQDSESLQRQEVAPAEEAVATSDPDAVLQVMDARTALIRSLFDHYPTEGQARERVRRALQTLDGDTGLLGRKTELGQDSQQFAQAVNEKAPDLTQQAQQLCGWVRDAIDNHTADSLTDVELKKLVQVAETRPKVTLDALKADYPGSWNDWFVRIIQQKKDDSNEESARQLQSQMNPFEIDPANIEQTIEDYRHAEVQLNLANPDNPADTVNMTLSMMTPYDISSRRNTAANPNAGTHTQVAWAKGSAEQTESAFQDYLNQNTQKETLSEVYYRVLHENMPQPTQGDQSIWDRLTDWIQRGWAGILARIAVQERAQTMLSSAQLGVDCSGLVVHVLDAAHPNMRATLMASAQADSPNNPPASFDKLVSNYANVKFLTSNQSGGAEGRYSSRLNDLSSAVPGTIIQMGTGHIGGVVRNDVYTLNSLPGEIAGSRAAIIAKLHVPNNDDQSVRVVKYYHSIDKSRPDDGQENGPNTPRYTNNNLPGPHTAWAVFKLPADGGTNDITDPTVWRQDEGGFPRMTGLYSVTQSDLIDGVN